MLISVDSADHYDEITQKYASDSTATISAGVGRNGTAGIVTTYATTFFVEELKVLNETVTASTLIVGMAFQLESLPAATATIFQFMESDNTPHICIGLESDGTITAFRGTSGGSSLASSASPILATTYYYLEVKVFIDNATGRIVVKLWDEAGISSTTIINFTGDTMNGGTGLLSTIGYGTDRSTGIPPSANWDDKYVCDSTGTSFNDFLGNKHIRTSFPESAGNYTQWQPFPSAPNYGNVNENPPDEGTTYNLAPSTDGDTDTFNTEDVDSSTVDAVVVNLCTALDVDSADGVSAVMRYDGQDSITEPIVPTTDYLVYQFPFEVAPDAGAWSTLKFNASESGYSVMAATTYWLLPYLSVYVEGAAVAISSPNLVQVLRVFVPYNILVSRMAIKIGTTDAGNFWGTGLYSEDGNTLILDSGPIGTDSPGITPVTLVTPVLIEAGMYWYAWTSDSGTATAGAALIDIEAATIREDGTAQYGHVANASVAGQLPSTLGAFTSDSPVTDHVPVTSLH